MTTAVQLAPCALYICTVPLLNGKFHWSLIHTSPTGTATRHHWAAAAASDPRGREAYVHQPLPRGPLSASAAQILGYFRVAPTAAAAAPHGPPWRDLAALRAVCAQVFAAAGYPSAEENRRHGISCRTWVTAVLHALGLDRERALAVEHAVTLRSQACEARYLRCYLRGEPYHVVVVEQV